MPRLLLVLPLCLLGHLHLPFVQQPMKLLFFPPLSTLVVLPLLLSLLQMPHQIEGWSQGSHIVPPDAPQQQQQETSYHTF
jgi:hypothetical protein